MATLKEEVLNETYGDVKKLIYKLCWRGVNRFGGEFDEYLSSANLAFCRAAKPGAWDSRKGHFSTYLWWCVWYAILDVERDKKRRMDRGPALVADLGGVEDKRRFDFTHFLTMLSEDAALVAELTVEAPGELNRLMRRGDRQGFCRMLWERLRGIGWSMARVVDSFDELKGVLE